jgi:hypothetical protein
MHSYVSMIARRLRALRKLCGPLAAAVVLAAFALPANAAKTISLSVTPVPAPLTSQTTAISAVITNTGNSNANSFEIDWSTSPYFTVTGATAGGTSGSCSTAGLRGPGYSSCVFLKQVPTKTSVTITLNVQVNNACNAMSLNWYAYAWTGAPGPASQSFDLQGAAPVTSSTPNCSIKFVTQPTDAFVGSTITGTPFNSTGAPVTVQLKRDGAPVVGTNVSLSAVPANCATGPGSAVTNASGNVALSFTAAAVSSCVLRASATEFGSVDSQSFNVVQQQGSLDCPGGGNTFGTTGANGLVLNGSRLQNVDDPAPDAVGGSTAPACVVVPYVVSTTCPTGVTGTCTNFVYDPLNQGTHMAFAFHWKWPLEPIPPNGVDGIAATLQFFINGNAIGLDLDLCQEIVPIYDANGNLTGVDPTKPPFDQDSAVAGTQAGCLITRTVKQVGDKVQVNEDAYVQGDYAARRN